LFENQESWMMFYDDYSCFSLQSPKLATYLIGAIYGVWGMFNATKKPNLPSDDP
jgi:hypothetical protein